MNRIIELFFVFIIFILMIIPFFIISIIIYLDSPGPILHWSKRIGILNQFFYMPKFRTMKINTPDIPTHLVDNPNQFLTNVGPFIRRYSLDELPQLYSILMGQMSFVGPRPALHNQDDLKTLRTEKNIHTLKPGITGWAQVMGRDTFTISEKVINDYYYLKNKSIKLDIKIIILTFKTSLRKNNISH